MKNVLSSFAAPIILSLFAVAGVGTWGIATGRGLVPMLLVGILAVLEISLSFDNAVVNARVLKDMDAVWQRRFLTWGVLVAVFGMRLFFPLAVVGFGSWMGPLQVIDLAFNHSAQYAERLESAHPFIAAFGGMFLLMVFLSFAFDASKDVHWLKGIESTLASLGNFKAIEIAVALIALLGASVFAAPVARTGILVAGLFGIVTFIAVDALGSLFGEGDEAAEVGTLTAGAARNGLGGFLYLEVLDASFSFDGTIGAFAVTQEILLIAVGLGIGAFWIRSLTLWLLQNRMLSEYVYLEHGAHWAIAVLAVLTLWSIATPVPEAVTGLSGVALITLSVWSSNHHKKRQREEAMVIAVESA